MSRLLVVDFDFFFRNPMEAGDARDPHVGLYDWGHAESPLMKSNVIWATRAAPFLAEGLPLPTVTPPDGGWPAFWARFTFAEDAYLSFGDSNLHAVEMTPGLLGGATTFETVLLFDAHHDSGYNIPDLATWQNRGIASCEDWMLVHQLRGCRDLTVRYPTWKPNGPDEPLPKGALTRQVVDDGQPVPGEFDAVYICRSGAWVPPWCDPEFLNLVAACPVEGMQYDDDEEPLDRRFDMMAQAEQLAAAIRELRGRTRRPAPDAD